MSFDLSVIRGPLKGERFAIDDGDELLIGRSARGVNLPDPLVSLRHARLVTRGDALFVTDLSSATGTQVNGEPLVAEVAVEVSVGDRLQVGDSVFLVDSGRARLIRRALLGAVPAWVMVLLATVLVFTATAETEITLGLQTPVRTHEGQVTQLTFPADFLRRYGISPSRLALRQVTDIDDDGVDELWLHTGDRERVVTFESDGRWTVLADLPHGCQLRDDRSIRCAGVSYRRVDGRYLPVQMDEPVVWLRATAAFRLPNPEDAEADPDADTTVHPGMAALARGQLVPYRVSAVRADELAGFLAERGVREAAHLVICERAIDGLPAQVVVDDGQAMPLASGCGSRLKLGGMRAEAFAGVQIAAIALTAPGQAALAGKYAYTVSGSETTVFLDPAQRALHAQLGAEPLLFQGSLGLVLGTTPHVFAPFAPAQQVPERVALHTNVPRPPDAVSATLTASGAFVFDVPGCPQLVVQTRSFRCALLRGCPPGFSFLRVDQAGCADGDPAGMVYAGYADGTYSGGSDEVEVRVEVESEGGFWLRDVRRARIAARPRYGG